MFLVGGGESNYFEICSDHSVLLNKGLSLRKTILPEPIPCGFCQSLTDVGERKYPVPALSSLPVPSKGGKNAEKLVKVTARGNKRLRSNHEITECLPLPTPYHHINRAVYNHRGLQWKELQASDSF